MCLPPGAAEDARRRALYDYCTIAQTAAEAVYFQWTRMVELVGIEPTTSSLRTMRSAKKPQFGVHLPADYGPKRSNSAGSPRVASQLFSRRRKVGPNAEHWSEIL